VTRSSAVAEKPRDAAGDHAFTWKKTVLNIAYQVAKMPNTIIKYKIFEIRISNTGTTISNAPIP